MARPKGGYFKTNGKPCIGTTTVCALLNKPAIGPWMAKLCTEQAWQIGRDGGNLPRWMDLVYAKRDAAADAGTLAHELFESHLRGLPLPPIPETDVGCAGFQAFENATHWLESSRLSIEPYEMPLVSEAYEFGGTPDALARSGDGTVFLADWKSGGIWPEHLVQMGAYKCLLWHCEQIDVQGCHLVRFSRDHGDFTHHYFAADALDQGWAIFERLLQIKPLLDALEKRVK